MEYITNKNHGGLSSLVLYKYKVASIGRLIKVLTQATKASAKAKESP